MIHVARDDFHQVVVRAAHGVAFDDMGLALHALVKVRSLLEPLLQGEVDVGRHRQSQRALIHLGRVALDHAVALEVLDPSKAGRLRKADPGGQLYIRQAAASLQRFQNLSLYSIQRHGKKTLNNFLAEKEYTYKVQYNGQNKRISAAHLI